MTEYRSAIVDECGDVVYWCDELTDEEVDDILDSHEEWSRKCICVGGGMDAWMF